MKEKLRGFGEVLENVSLKEYNTFHVGGFCKYFIFPKDIFSLQSLIQELKNLKEKYFILGNGSNIIFSDDYYDGVIICLKCLKKVEVQEEKIIAGAGVMLPSLAMTSIKEGLSGLEWAVGIPGTLGGAIYGNAGAYKSSIFDFLISITVLDSKNEIVTLKKEDISYGYRTSFFKENSDFVILEAILELKKGNSLESMEKVFARKEKRLLTQPLEYPSAGSVFRNPGECPSGKLIEDLGLKGKRIGDAVVSDKHANFIVNMGSATSNDIRNLIELVHREVKEHYHIDLVMEQEYVGWDKDEEKQSNSEKKNQIS